MRTCEHESEGDTGYRVRATSVFEEDLGDAIAYQREVLCAPAAAQRLVDAVDEAKLLLESMPYAHAVSARWGDAERGYREHRVRGYVIVYCVNGEEIVLLRMFHQTQRYERLPPEWS